MVINLLISKQQNRQSPDQVLSAQTLCILAAPTDGAEANIDGEVETKNPAQEAEDVVDGTLHELTHRGGFDLTPGSAFQVRTFNSGKVDGRRAGERLSQFLGWGRDDFLAGRNCRVSFSLSRT